jgi:endonuclease/exonuclease/phosphatase family metal-dependent hydrolase
MSELKIATFNAEWMISIFGGQWTDWKSPYIPQSFPGKKISGIQLEPIADVPALCERIAGVIQDVGAQIIGIEEAPPLIEQMQVFVQRFLNDDYVVHYSNANLQSICALVHRSISDAVTSLDPAGIDTVVFRTPIPYYPWGAITQAEQKLHTFSRIPLILDFNPGAGKVLRIIDVHTKSKYSLLKTKEQWQKRDRAAILDALDVREALSAEVMCLRQYLNTQLVPPDENNDIVLMGDLNDGPFGELMEQEFLIHNIIDELVGTLLLPQSNFRHAMQPDVLATSTSVNFPDPLQNGQIVSELIDHILVSPGIWQGKAPFPLVEGSCQVEVQAYEAHNDDNGPTRQRGLRPSDHKPVSAVFTY